MGGEVPGWVNPCRELAERKQALQTPTHQILIMNYINKKNYREDRQIDTCNAPANEAARSRGAT